LFLVSEQSGAGAQLGRRRRLAIIRFSVLIPTYKTAKSVRRAIEAALEQTHAAREVLVGDDCSP
jgi:hypothetical protein